MSPRPIKSRQVGTPFSIKGMRPYGCFNEEKEPVQLQFEEMESIRLCDYLGLRQLEASICMGVSRPTLTRVYKNARKKMAIAMSEGRPIEFGGGQYTLDENWEECSNCHSAIFNSKQIQPGHICILCGNKNLNNELQPNEKNKNNRYAIVCSTASIESKLSSVFARGPYFCITNEYGEVHEIIKNPFWQDQSCVGENVINFIYKYGVNVIIGADIGQNILSHIQQKNMVFILIRNPLLSSLKIITQLITNSESYAKT